MNNSTALRAENIIFISDAHEKFYYEKLKEVRYQDAYHKALCYCLGINEDEKQGVGLTRAMNMPIKKAIAGLKKNLDRIDRMSEKLEKSVESRSQKKRPKKAQGLL